MSEEELIRAKDAIWADDRRVEQVGIYSIVPTTLFPRDKRINDFTYPSDKLIIEVPLDPQPPSLPK